MHRENRIMPRRTQTVSMGQSCKTESIKAPLHSIVMLVFLIFGISIGIIFVFLILMLIGLAAS